MKLAALVASLCLAIAAGGFWLYAVYGFKAPVATMQHGAMRHGSMNPEKDAASFATIAAWRDRIKAIGAEPAYSEFRISAGELDPGASHMQAHLFGAALYAEKGDTGFPVCGSYFSYGCAHALIAAAIEKEGESAAGKFADACRKTTWPAMCLHGIGHGLMRTTDYTDAAIRKVLGLCIDQVNDTSTEGCVGGAIMEYDGQSMTPGMPSGRIMTDKNTYEPCRAAPEPAKSPCYYWIVSWWYDSLVAQKLNAVEVFKKLGPLCDHIPDTQFASECYAGEGIAAAAASGYTAPAAGALCDMAQVDATARMYCRAFAATILLDGETGESNLKNLCSAESLPQERCEIVARKGISVFN